MHKLIAQLLEYTSVPLGDFHRHCDALVVGALSVVWKLLGYTWVCSPTQSPELSLPLLLMAPSEAHLETHWCSCLYCGHCCKLFCYYTSILATWTSPIREVWVFMVCCMSRENETIEKLHCSHVSCLFSGNISCLFA